MYLTVSLNEILRRKGMTQKELASITGLTETVISEVINNRRSSINRNYLSLIIEALDIEDMNDIFKMN